MTRTAGLAEAARLMLAERGALARHLDPGLCADPAIDILLFLFVESEEGSRTTTAACCEAVGAPRTTALRWIAKLAEHGLVEPGDDPADRRVTLLRLTEAGCAAMTDWLREIGRG